MWSSTWFPWTSFARFDAAAAAVATICAFGVWRASHARRCCLLPQQISQAETALRFPPKRSAVVRCPFQLLRNSISVTSAEPESAASAARARFRVRSSTACRVWLLLDANRVALLRILGNVNSVASAHAFVQYCRRFEHRSDERLLGGGPDASSTSLSAVAAADLVSVEDPALPPPATEFDCEFALDGWAGWPLAPSPSSSSSPSSSPPSLPVASGSSGTPTNGDDDGDDDDRQEALGEASSTEPLLPPTEVRAVAVSEPLAAAAPMSCFPLVVVIEESAPAQPQQPPQQPSNCLYIATLSRSSGDQRLSLEIERQVLVNLATGEKFVIKVGLDRIGLRCCTQSRVVFIVAISPPARSLVLLLVGRAGRVWLR